MASVEVLSHDNGIDFNQVEPGNPDKKIPSFFLSQGPRKGGGGGGEGAVRVKFRLDIRRYRCSLVDTRPIPYRYFTASLPMPY